MAGRWQTVAALFYQTRSIVYQIASMKLTNYSKPRKFSDGLERSLQVSQRSPATMRAVHGRRTPALRAPSPPPPRARGARSAAALPRTRAARLLSARGRRAGEGEGVRVGAPAAPSARGPRTVRVIVGIPIVGASNRFV